MTVSDLYRQYRLSFNHAAQFADFLSSYSVWDERACMGYVMAAAHSIGLPDDQLSKLIDCMNAAFGEMTIDQAVSYFQSGE